jgi:siroheme synthase
MANMRAAGHSGELPALLIANGTTGQQQSIHGTLATLADNVRNQDIESPALVIIGEVVDLATGHSAAEPAADEEALWSAPAAMNGH